MSRKITIAVVDSEGPYRKAVKQQLSGMPDVELVGEAENLPSGLELLSKVRPDVVVLELPQRTDETLERIEQWRAEMPEMLIFVSSASKKPDLILSAMRSGAVEYLSKPLEVAEFQTAVEKAVRQKKSGMQRAGGGSRVLAVFSRKGGLGVTTIAVNLAMALGANEHSRTVLVDLAPDMGDATSQLDIQPKYALRDILDKSGRVHSGNLQSTLLRHSSGIYCLAEREAMPETEQITPSHVFEMLSALREEFHHVVIDLPHVLDAHSYEAFQIADTILLVATADLASIRSTRYALKILRTLGYDNQKVQIVLNRVSKKDAITVDQFTETLQYPVSWQVSSDYMTVIDSINTGDPVVHSKPKSAVARDLVAMANDLNVNGPPPEEKRGLFQRAFGG